MFGKTEKEVIEYRMSIQTALIKIIKDTSGILIFYYKSNDNLKVFDAYYMKNKICVGYAEFYKNTRSNRKTILTKNNTSYKLKQKDIWINDNIEIYLYRTKTTLKVIYIPNKKYLMTQINR